MKKTLFCTILLIICCFGALTGCRNRQDKLVNNLNTYTIDATYDDNTKSLTACQKLDYTNTSDVVFEFVCFNLYPNAFRKDAACKPVSTANIASAYPNGMSYGDIQVTKATVDSVDVKFDVGGQDQNILTVYLDKQLYPDDKVTIGIDFVVTLPNINHRFGYGDNTHNFGNFYPIVCVYENGFFDKPYNANGDPFYSEVANYNVSLHFDPKFVIAHTGRQISCEVGDKKVVNIVAQAVRDFAFVLSEKYQVASKTEGKTVVSYFYYSDDAFEQNLQTAVDALKTFNNLFGEYPYSTLNVAKTNFVHGGMEYPNLVYISDAVTDKAEYQNTIVHEIAHQWWYNLVGSNAYDNAWQDEGLTEFSTILFYENNPQYNVDTNERLNNTLASYMLFVDVFESVNGNLDTSMNRALNEYTSEIEYVYMTYVKGNLMFDHIRQVMGTKKFVKAMQYYYKHNLYKNAKPQNLISALNKNTSCDMESFVESYLSGKAIIKQYK